MSTSLIDWLGIDYKDIIETISYMDVSPNSEQVISLNERTTTQLTISISPPPTHKNVIIISENKYAHEM